ncbi:MAG TPA: hypothetical protein VG452_08255 [Egibacteraceae bacterium]|nr:hypothetical protein [Egibacteraceae bacterium]
MYRQPGLGQRRPVDGRERMARMLAGANLVVSAWDGDGLVGLARSLSDFSYVTYLADLAVRRSHRCPVQCRSMRARAVVGVAGV